MSEQTNVVEKIANSAFMKKLEDVSLKLSSSPVFTSISHGMGGTMGLIMVGAVFQVICVIGSTFLGWDPNGALYTLIYTPYKYTMGILAFFMCYSLASSYGNNLRVSPMMAGFTSMVCYLIVCCPIVAIEGTEYFAIGGFGSTNLFAAIIIALVCPKIMKFCKDKNLALHLPPSVPDGIAQSFNAIIPTAICVIFWYALATGINKVTGTTLSNIIMYVLSIPMNVLISDVGMFVICFLGLLFWFFGIHGTGVIFTAIMVPMFAAYATNAELAAQGLPLQYSPVFLYSMCSIVAGSGNTLPLVVMGLKSKSETIRAVCKAALIPNICNINEPVIFGFPIMYNATLAIPFFLNPMIVGVLYLIGLKTGILACPQVLILTCLPYLVATFMSTLDIKNVIFAALCFPIVYIIWLPFFKIYEKQMIEQEQAGNSNI